MKLKFIVYILTCYVLSNCQNNIENKNKSTIENIFAIKNTEQIKLNDSFKIQSKNDINNLIDSYCDSLDNSINNIFYFNNGSSMRNAFPNIDSAWKLNDRPYFLTKDSSKYISFGFNYGGFEYEYKEAEIGFVEGPVNKFIPNEVLNSGFNPNKTDTTIYPAFYFLVSDFDDFETGWGIHLNLKETEFLKIMQGKNINKISQKDKIIYYYYSEDCFYKGKYVFKEGLLILFSFGYITP